MGRSAAGAGYDLVENPAAKEIALHQDSTYISFLDPPEMMSCWITLDDTSRRRRDHRIRAVHINGRWSRSRAIFMRPSEATAPQWNRPPLRSASQPRKSRLRQAPAGSCVFHHGNIWHGSSPNTRTDKVRRSIRIHTLSAETKFRPAGAGYIYGRYQRVGDLTMDESFFPILWTQTATVRLSWRQPN